MRERIKGVLADYRDDVCPPGSYFPGSAPCPHGRKGDEEFRKCGYCQADRILTLIRELVQGLAVTTPLGHWFANIEAAVQPEGFQLGVQQTKAAVLALLGPNNDKEVS